MRQVKNNILMVMVLLIAVFSFVSIAVAKDEFLMSWEEWAPFQYKDSSGQLTGLDVELMSAIMKNAGLTLNFKEMPWNRSLMELEKGNLDIAPGASKTAEREAYALFSMPYRKETAVLYVKKGTSGKYKFDNLSDIIGSDFQLGVVRGYYYGEAYDQLMKDPGFQKQVQDSSADKTNLNKLIKGRINGFLMEPVAATALLKEEGLQNEVEIHPMTVYSDDIYVMFSKQSTSASDVSVFNKSLEELKASGVYQQIMDKYLK